MCSSRPVLAGDCSCGQSERRTQRCPLHCGRHKLSKGRKNSIPTVIKTNCSNVLVSLPVCGCLVLTLQFCSQNDLGMNWTGRWVLMRRGVVGRESARFLPVWKSTVFLYGTGLTCINANATLILAVVLCSQVSSSRYYFVLHVLLNWW